MKPASAQWSPGLDREFIDQVLARQTGRPGGLLAILQQIQNNHPRKYLPRETIEYVAAKTNVPLSRKSSASPLFTRCSIWNRRVATRFRSAAAPPVTPEDRVICMKR